jgi:hypothetical protein
LNEIIKQQDKYTGKLQSEIERLQYEINEGKYLKEKKRSLDELNLKFQKINVDKEQAISKHKQLITIQQVHQNQLLTLQAEVVKTEKRKYDLEESLAQKKLSSKEKIARDLRDYRNKEVYSLKQEYETCKKNNQFKLEQLREEESRFHILETEKIKQMSEYSEIKSN